MTPLIKKLEHNLAIAEREGDHWGAARIKMALEVVLAPHIKRARKLFLPQQPREER